MDNRNSPTPPTPFKNEASDFLSYSSYGTGTTTRQSISPPARLRNSAKTLPSYTRMREWHDTHQQLHALVTEMGLL